MLRILTALAFLLVAGPSFAEQATETVVSQQQQKPPSQAPKRDCERQQGEGVS